MGIARGMAINDMAGWSTPRLGTDRYEYRVYQLWKSMMRRCYDDKHMLSHQTYRGCTVCERWRRLSNFAEDVNSIPGFDLWLNNKGKYFLDKDTVIPGNKEYAPGKVIFISDSQSALEVNSRVGSKMVLAMKDSHARTVLCENLIDGSIIEYDSCTSAARSQSISQQSMSERILKGVIVNDLRFTYKEV